MRRIQESRAVCCGNSRFAQSRHSVRGPKSKDDRQRFRVARQSNRRSEAERRRQGGKQEGTKAGEPRSEQQFLRALDLAIKSRGHSLALFYASYVSLSESCRSRSMLNGYSAQL